jgi:hypothetical protein
VLANGLRKRRLKITSSGENKTLCSFIGSKRELGAYKVKDKVISFSNSASEHPGVRVNGGVTLLSLTPAPNVGDPFHFPAVLQLVKNLIINSWEEGLMPYPKRKIQKREKYLPFPKIEPGLLSRLSRILLAMLNKISYLSGNIKSYLSHILIRQSARC